MDLRLEPITEEFKYLDEVYAINDEAFPEQERIPSGSMLEVMRQYGCTPLAIMDSDELVGFVAIVPYYPTSIGYMWFFAIAADKRDRGYGGCALQELQQKFPQLQLVLDMEQIDHSAPNYEQRLRRLRFYERNGFSRAMVGMSYFGMDFEIMNTQPPFRIDDFRAYLANAASRQWKPRLYPLEDKS